MLVQFLPVVRRDAVDEEVGVVGRIGNERQDAAGGRVDGDQCALAVAEGLFGDFLQPGIQGQLKVVAGNRWNPLQAAHGTAAGVDLDFLVAGFTVQLELVVLLQTVLANVVGALVIRLLFLFLDPFQVVVGDPPDVAEGVRTDCPKGVLAEEAGLDLNPREAVTLGSELGDFSIAQSRADGDRLEVFGFVHQALEALAVLGLDIDHLGQRVDRRFQVVNLGGRDFQRECRIVAGEDDAVAVGDDPPVGHDRDQRDAVVFGAGAIEVMLNDL